MGNIYVVKETTLTIEKKSLVLVLPCLGSISLQTRTKLKKSLKNILNCCKLQIVLKNKTKLDNNSYFKGRIPNESRLCNESYYGECVRDSNIRLDEHIGISPPENKLSLRTALLPTIYYSTTIQRPMRILVF